MYSKHSYSLFPKVTCIMGRIFSPRFGISETILGEKFNSRKDGWFWPFSSPQPAIPFLKTKPPKRCLVLDFWYSIFEYQRGPLVWYSSWGNQPPSTLGILPLKNWFSPPKVPDDAPISSSVSSQFLGTPEKRLTVSILRKWTRNPE